MDIHEHIGAQIRKLRQEARLSQGALAEKIGVTTNTISRWETAVYRVRIADLQKVAAYFGVGLSAFLPPENGKRRVKRHV